MVDKDYAMSSYLALKYIEKDNVDFFEGMKHSNYLMPSVESKIMVRNAEEMNAAISMQLSSYLNQRVGVLLSGGMDSAIVASYFPKCDAYTFRYIGADYPDDELKRAEQFADYYNINLHYVDIDFESILASIDELMKQKASPVYYIEPQLTQAAKQAKGEGIEVIMVGEGSDMVFGGLSWLLARDWTVKEFKDMYINLSPEKVLCKAVSMDYVFERYGNDDGMMDVNRFINEVFAVEAYTAYKNAFSMASIPFFDPFEKLIMADALDINRVRNGEPKYLVRELFSMRYPELPIPEKIRMPNPLDVYMRSWIGPKRKEFLPNIDVSSLKGKQKWQIYCLERFLNTYDMQ